LAHERDGRISPRGVLKRRKGEAQREGTRIRTKLGKERHGMNSLEVTTGCKPMRCCSFCSAFISSSLSKQRTCVEVVGWENIIVVIIVIIVIIIIIVTLR